MEKYLGVLADEKLAVSQQCAFVACTVKWILGYVKKEVASSMRSNLSFWSPIWSSQHKKRGAELGVGPQEGHKADQRDGVPLQQRKAEVAGLLQPGEHSEGHAGSPVLKGRLINKIEADILQSLIVAGGSPDCRWVGIRQFLRFLQPKPFCDSTVPWF